MRLALACLGLACLALAGGSVAALGDSSLECLPGSMCGGPTFGPVCPDLGTRQLGACVAPSLGPGFAAVDWRAGAGDASGPRSAGAAGTDHDGAGLCWTLGFSQLGPWFDGTLGLDVSDGVPHFASEAGFDASAAQC